MGKQRGEGRGEGSQELAVMDATFKASIVAWLVVTAIIFFDNRIKARDPTTEATLGRLRTPLRGGEVGDAAPSQNSRSDRLSV